MELQHNITYRKKDKGWQFIISYKTEKIGKWKQKSKQGFISKLEAKKASDKALEELKDTLLKENLLDKNFKNVTLKEFKFIFLEHIKLHNTLETINSYEVSLRAFNILEQHYLHSITKREIQDCIDRKTMDGIKESSLKLYLNKLSNLFKYAIDQNIIINNPAKGITINADKENIKKEALTLSELYDLVDRFKNSRSTEKFTLAVLIAGTCGLRVQEILGLTWSDIDFKNGLMKIERQWKRLSKKPTKYGFGTLKSKNSYRTLPIPPKTLEALFNYKKYNPVNFDNRIFNVISSSSFKTEINIKLKQYGYNMSFHELRHTYATNLISSGIDFKTAASLLGHDVKQTMNIYSHVTNEMFNRASELVKKSF
ncbi:MAG: site-specific integrase [Fusobacterium necrophorum]|nr:site-specific integrase [Fusobacterium necrophorum]